MTTRDKARMTLTLSSDREFTLTRVFDAPRRLVFEAWTNPEHVRQWYGCSTFTLTVCEIDLRLGGAYRYTMRAPNGVDHTMRGIYRDIVPFERLVYMEQYVTVGFTSSEAIVTINLVEEGGRTTLISKVLHQSKADRDAHLGSGVEAGAAETLDRLAGHLATMG